MNNSPRNNQERNWNLEQGFLLDLFKKNSALQMRLPMQLKTLSQELVNQDPDLARPNQNQILWLLLTQRFQEGFATRFGALFWLDWKSISLEEAGHLISSIASEIANARPLSF